MSRIGRAAARLAIGLYPRAWRARYADELLDLVREVDVGVGGAVDMVAAAARLYASGGTPMRFEPAHRHPMAFALVAFAIMAPTLAFVTLSIIGHELGVSAVAKVVDPVLVAITRPRIVDVALVAAPAAAALLALLPLLDVRVERGDEGQLVALRVRALPVNLAVGAIALLLGATLVLHIVSEAVLHAGA
jgi:hypothetical protein